MPLIFFNGLMLIKVKQNNTFKEETIHTEKNIKKTNLTFLKQQYLTQVFS